jgi:hypothetical protein
MSIEASSEWVPKEACLQHNSVGSVRMGAKLSVCASLLSVPPDGITTDGVSPQSRPKRENSAMSKRASDRWGTSTQGRGRVKT